MRRIDQLLALSAYPIATLHLKKTSLPYIFGVVIP
jgi:hypothetical protein